MGTPVCILVLSCQKGRAPCGALRWNPVITVGNRSGGHRPAVGPTPAKAGDAIHRPGLGYFPPLA